MKKLLLGLLGCGLIFIAVGLTQNNLRVRVIDIKDKKIKENKTYVLLTDIHNSDLISKLENHLKNLSIDGYLIGGDLLDEKTNNEQVIPLLEYLVSQKPVYYVTGNHEYRLDDLEKYLSKFRELGVNVLNNETAPLSSSIALLGVDDAVSEYTFLNRKSDDSKYNVVLVHRPQFFKEYVNLGYDLVLSGHAHGGQWKIPFTNQGLLAPDQGLFPKYSSGTYFDEKGMMVVSGGLSLDKEYIFRLYNPYEIIVLNFIVD